MREHRPECVAIENIFHAVNARSALKLGHARGVAMLAAIEAGVTVVEYTPAEIKRAVVGYGRAGEAAGRADGEDAAGTRHDSEAARCDRRARGGDLSSAQRQARALGAQGYERRKPARPRRRLSPGGTIAA